jgi:cellobiose transport system permease protein
MTITGERIAGPPRAPGEPGPRARRPVPGWRRLARTLDEKGSPYAYVSPFFLIFAAFGLFPLLYTAYVSLTNRNLLNPQADFVGLHNYSLLIHDSYFWNALVNTLGIWIISTLPQLLLALALAHLLNTKLHARTFFRMSLILPQVTSVVAVALIFTQLFGRDYGLANYVLHLFGIHRIDWEAGRLTSWIALSVMVTWRWTGFNALIYLAAMQAIPLDLYESASLDGANGWQQFRHLTIPLLRPTIIFTVIVSTIGGLQLFTEPFLFEAGHTGATGGSARQFQTLAMYLYEKAFGSGQFKFGYASAIAWSLFLLIVLVSLVNYGITRRIRSTE